jgi:hypothetical protein
LQLVRDVQSLRLVSGRQLQLLHFGASEAAARAARRCLSRLTAGRFLVRLQRRIGGIRAGSAGYIYVLGSAGRRVLDPTARGRGRRDYEVNDGFLQHTLGVAEVVVELRRADAAGLYRLLEWQAEPRSWRRVRGTVGEIVKPDLFTITSDATGAVEQHSFVEVDGGTEHRAAVLRKLALYERAYRAGIDSGDLDDVFPRVVWLVPDEARQRWLQQLVGRSSAVTSELHLVALQGDLRALWPPGGSEEGTYGDRAQEQLKQRKEVIDG